MSQLNLVELAQTGDANAIAALMNTSLQTLGIQARAALLEGDLYVLLESEQLLDQPPCIEFIRRGLTRLGMAWVSSAVIYSRVKGQNLPAWVERVELLPQGFTNPFALEPDATLEMEEPLRWRLPSWSRGTLLDLMLLSIPIWLVLSSSYIWSRYLSEKHPAMPPTLPTRSLGISSGIELIVPEATGAASAPSDPFQTAFRQAIQADKLSHAARSREEIQAAVQAWKQTLALLQAVPESHPQAASAQQKRTQYQQRLAELEDKLAHPQGMELVKIISGAISPKSITYTGKDLFFAQNMMYSHTITVYDRQYNLVKTISDAVKLADYGYPQFPGTQKGAPVEAAPTPDGQHVWVSNYQMYGSGFKSAADDDCNPAQDNDQSFLYRISTRNLEIDRAVRVGSVPKVVAASPDNRFVLVSNWCSWDISVVDAQQNQEVRRIQVGPYPRGIAIDPTSRTAYVAVMGSSDIAAIDLQDFSVSWLRGVGRAPRHLNLDPTGRWLYVTLSNAGDVAKIDLTTRSVVSRVATGAAPRSMTISADGNFLYVVNYNSDTVSKIRTQDMQVVQTVKVNPAPIGVTYDPEIHQVWVACYSGSILVFQD